MHIQDCVWCGQPLGWIAEMAQAPICTPCWKKNGEHEPVPFGTELTPEIIEQVEAMKPLDIICPCCGTRPARDCSCVVKVDPFHWECARHQRHRFFFATSDYAKQDSAIPHGCIQITEATLHDQ